MKEYGAEGIQNGLSFTITSSVDSCLTPATYPYVDPSSYPNLNSLVSGMLSVSNEKIGLMKELIVNGTLKISQNNTIYTLEYSGLDGKGEDIKCFYSGKIKCLD